MKNFGSAPTSSHLCYYNSLSTYWKMPLSLM
jgi:hypothetical protein